VLQSADHSHITVLTRIAVTGLFSASVASVTVTAQAIWSTVSTMATSAGVCGGSGAVCREWPRLVQSADLRDIIVLTGNADTTPRSALVATSAGACGGSGAVCLGPPWVLQPADHSDINVLTGTADAIRPSASVATGASVCGGSGAVCLDQPRVVQSADRSDISLLTGNADTTPPPATVASVPVRVEAVVQCVEGGCEWCRQLMIRTSLSSPHCYHRSAFCLRGQRAGAGRGSVVHCVDSGQECWCVRRQWCSVSRVAASGAVG
jgi:hypothetical protein